MSLYSLKQIIPIPYISVDIPVQMSVYTPRKNSIYAFQNKLCMYSFNKSSVYTPLKDQCVLRQRNQYILLVYEVYTLKKIVYTHANVRYTSILFLLFHSYQV